MSAITHMLRADNMRIGHVRGVQPIPFGAKSDDGARLRAESEARIAVQRVLPMVKEVTIKWLDGSRFEAWIPLTGPMGRGGGKSHKVATFRIGSVA